LAAGVPSSPGVAPTKTWMEATGWSPLKLSPVSELPFWSHETDVVLWTLTQWRAVRTTLGAMSEPEHSSKV